MKGTGYTRCIEPTLVAYFKRDPVTANEGEVLNGFVRHAIHVVIGRERDNSTAVKSYIASWKK